MMRIRGQARRLWLWASLPCATPAIRDLIATVAISQGLVRIIDGRLFALTQVTYLDHLAYGILQLIVGLWLVSTRWSMLRPSGSGRMAAAMMAGTWTMLAVEAWGKSGTSWVSALIFAWAMAIEARWHDAIATD